MNLHGCSDVELCSVISCAENLSGDNTKNNLEDNIVEDLGVGALPWTFIDTWEQNGVLKL